MPEHILSDSEPLDKLKTNKTRYLIISLESGIGGQNKTSHYQNMARR